MISSYTRSGRNIDRSRSPVRGRNRSRGRSGLRSDKEERRQLEREMLGETVSRSSVPEVAKRHESTKKPIPVGIYMHVCYKGKRGSYPYNAPFLPPYDIPIDNLLKNQGEYTCEQIKKLIEINGSLLCKGDVSNGYIIHQVNDNNNDLNMILMSQDKEVLGFIIARKGRTQTFYIEIICAKTGYGSALLKWFINFVFLRDPVGRSDPAYGVERLSLSALGSVLYYYPKFGYLHVKNCGDPEDPEITSASMAVPPLSDGQKDTKSNEFVKFLFLLTRNGFNSQDTVFNKTCETITSALDFNNQKVVWNLKDEFPDADFLKLYEKDKNWRESKNLSKSQVVEIENSRRKFNQTFEEYQRNPNDENMRKYFQATFEYAKNLYYYIYDCNSQGYKMLKCNRSLTKD